MKRFLTYNGLICKYILYVMYYLERSCRNFFQLCQELNQDSKLLHEFIQNSV